MRQNNTTVVLGVTGGIGSGKSTVSKILAKLGAYIIDADAISKEIVNPEEKALVELTEAFGKDILDDCGRLNRKKVAAEVFSSAEKLELINSIMHKHVSIRIKEKVKEQLLKNTKIIVIDAPIPIEDGFLNQCQTVWTVTADKELRIKRVMERSGLSYEDAVSRINSQLSEQEYTKIANTVLENNHDIIRLENEVKYQLSKLLG